MKHHPDHRTRALDPIHPTAPRVGIFAQAARVRSTGPKAHLSPYIADEERSVRKQVRHALVVLSVSMLSCYCSIRICIAAWHFIRGWISL